MKKNKINPFIHSFSTYFLSRDLLAVGPCGKFRKTEMKESLPRKASALVGQSRKQTGARQ